MRFKSVLPLVVFVVFSNGYSQDLNNDLEDRIGALESAVATLDTRLQTRTTTGAGSLAPSVAGLSVQSRLDDLTRQVQSLNRQVVMLQRQVEQASREAALAIRGAEAAQRDARDALSRTR